MDIINFAKPPHHQTTRREFMWWLMITLGALGIMITVTILLYVQELETKTRLEHTTQGLKSRQQQFEALEKELQQATTKQAELQASLEQYKKIGANSLQLKNVVQQLHNFIEAEQGTMTSLVVGKKTLEIQLTAATLQAINNVMDKLNSTPEFKNNTLVSIQSKDDRVIATIKSSYA